MSKEEGAMSSRTPKKKTNKVGDIVRFEPRGMALINSNPNYMETFRKAGCLKFCQKLDGHHVDVAYMFVFNYNGNISKMGELVIPVTKQYIFVATGIPVEGEKMV